VAVRGPEEVEVVIALTAGLQEMIGPFCMWEGGEEVVKATVREKVVEVDRLCCD